VNAVKLAPSIYVFRMGMGIRVKTTLLHIRKITLPKRSTLSEGFLPQKKRGTLGPAYIRNHTRILKPVKF